MGSGSSSSRSGRKTCHGERDGGFLGAVVEEVEEVEVVVVVVVVVVVESAEVEVEVGSWWWWWWKTMWGSQHAPTPMRADESRVE